MPPTVEFMDGGELGQSVGLWDFASVSPSTGAVAAGFSGEYYYARSGGYCQKVVTARDSYYMGVRIKNEGWIFNIYGNNTGGSYYYLCKLQNEGNRLHYYAPGGVDSYSTYITDGSVMRVEMYVLRNTYTPATPYGAGTPNSDGVVIVKVNGVIIMNLTGIRSVGYNYPMTLWMVAGEWATWDDAILTVDDWPGNVRIQGGVPNEAGSSTEWDPSTGNNFECVNEVPPSDTDFNSTNVSDELDMYGMTPLVETYPIESILGIQLSARAKLEETATPKDLQLAILSGATYDYSSNKQVEDDTYKWPSQVWSLNPATGKPFTPAEINSLQIGIKSKTR